MNTTGHMTSSDAPRKSVLVTLTAAVLFAHALLLLGTPSLWPSRHLSIGNDAGEPAPAAPGMEPANNEAATTASATNLPSVLHSQVRWIPIPAAPRLTDTSPPPAAPAQGVVKRPKTEPVAALPEPVPPPQQPLPLEAPSAGAEAPQPQENVAIASPAPEASPLPAEEQPAPSAPPSANGGSASQGEAAHGPLAPASTVRDTELTYDVEGLVKGFPFHAQGILQWRQREDRYEARLEIKAFLIGSRVQTSTGKLGSSGLQPERFSDRSRSEKAAHFDQATGRIRFSNNARDAQLRAGAQDRLSVFMQLAALLEARPQAYPPGTKIDMQVAGTGSAEVWTFKVESAAEPLNLPAGELPAIRLYRPPQLEYDNALEVWLAPQLHHLPVRIRITQKNGDVADQQLNFVPKVELAR